MKTKEQNKKLINLNQTELLQEKLNADKACKLSRFEVSFKKSKNFNKIKKYRKNKARILTIINSRVKKDE